MGAINLKKQSEANRARALGMTQRRIATYMKAAGIVFRQYEETRNQNLLQQTDKLLMMALFETQLKNRKK